MTKEEVPGNVLDKEREIYKAQAAAAGKPPAVQEKIAEGKLKQYLSEVCLLEQPFIRENDKTVGQLIQEKIGLIKENIVVRRFARFKVGEEARAAAPAEGARSRSWRASRPGGRLSYGPWMKLPGPCASPPSGSKPSSARPISSSSAGFTPSRASASRTR